MKFKRLLAVLVLLSVLCLPILSSCERTKDVWRGEGGHITVGEKGEMLLQINPEKALLKKNKGQTVQIYEYPFWQTELALEGRSPIAEAKLEKHMKIEIPMEGESGIPRLYSSFIAVLPSGETLFATPVRLETPELLAKDGETFPGDGQIKGLGAGDEILSSSLYSAHTLVELRLSDLFSGDGFLAKMGATELMLDFLIMAQTDRQILQATNARMQVTLRLVLDFSLSFEEYATVLNCFLTRYNGENECGEISALILGFGEARTSENAETQDRDAEMMARLMSLANYGLRAQFRSGRVYLELSGTADAALSYAKAVLGKTSLPTDASFGVALSPDPVTKSMSGQKDGDTPYFNLSHLSELSQRISRELRGARMCVIGLDFPSSDLDLQAALYAFAYRSAAVARADFMIYRHQTDEQYGLFDQNGNARPLAEIFLYADTNENSRGEALAAELLSNDWDALKTSHPARILTKGYANEGEYKDKTALLFDFSSGNHPSFFTVGNGYAPSIVLSEGLKTHVLASSLSPSSVADGSGFAADFESAKKLTDAHALTIKLLAQTRVGKNARVTLLLDGRASDGRLLSYRSTVTLSANEWKTVTFHVREFTSQVDPESPYRLTLLMLPEEGGEDFALMLHSARVRGASGDSSALVLALTVAFGLAVSAAAIVTIVLVTRARRRQKR